MLNFEIKFDFSYTYQVKAANNYFLTNLASQYINLMGYLIKRIIYYRQLFKNKKAY